MQAGAAQAVPLQGSPNAVLSTDGFRVKVEEAPPCLPPCLPSADFQALPPPLDPSPLGMPSCSGVKSDSANAATALWMKPTPPMAVRQLFETSTSGEAVTASPTVLCGSPVVGPECGAAAACSSYYVNNNNREETRGKRPAAHPMPVSNVPIATLN